MPGETHATSAAMETGASRTVAGWVMMCRVTPGDPSHDPIVLDSLHAELRVSLAVANSSWGLEGMCCITERRMG